jgi:hypothetical protein
MYINMYITGMAIPHASNILRFILPPHDIRVFCIAQLVGRTPLNRGGDVR